MKFWAHWYKQTFKLIKKYLRYLVTSKYSCCSKWYVTNLNGLFGRHPYFGQNEATLYSNNIFRTPYNPNHALTYYRHWNNIEKPTFKLIKKASKVPTIFKIFWYIVRSYMLFQMVCNKLKWFGRKTSQFGSE